MLQEPIFASQLNFQAFSNKNPHALAQEMRIKFSETRQGQRVRDIVFFTKNEEIWAMVILEGGMIT